VCIIQVNNRLKFVFLPLFIVFCRTIVVGFRIWQNVAGLSGSANLGHDTRTFTAIHLLYLLTFSYKQFFYSHARLFSDKDPLSCFCFCIFYIYILYCVHIELFFTIIQAICLSAFYHFIWRVFIFLYSITYTILYNIIFSRCKLITANNTYVCLL